MQSPLRLLRDCRAATALEFGLVAIPLALFLFGTIETGRVLWIQNALEYAVQQGARCATVNPSVCDTALHIASFAATQSSMSFAASVFTAGTAACGNQVSASYPISLAIPFAPLSLTLTASACYPS